MLELRFLRRVLMKTICRHWSKESALRWVLLFGFAATIIRGFGQWLEWGGVQGRPLLEAVIYLAWVFCFGVFLIEPTISWKRNATYFLVAGVVGSALAGLVPILVLSVIYGGMQLAGNEFEAGIRNQSMTTIGLAALWEEVSKITPLLIFGLGKNRIRSGRAGLVLGFVSGAGFGTFEALLAVPIINSVGNIAFRLIAGPLVHGAWSAIAGWFIGIAACSQRSRGAIITGGILLATLLHFLVNTFAFRHMPGIRFHFEVVSLLTFTVLLVCEPSRPTLAFKAHGRLEA